MPNTVTFTPQDYTATLAMLNHEGANGINALLRSGNNADALGYVGGLIDTWTNRAAATGRTPWQEMNRPAQISFWDPSEIQSKASSLSPQIKALADAYLQYRANGGQAVAPSASFYLNTDLVRATPSYGTKYQDWYDPGTVVAAYGDKRSGGKSSLQTEFVQNNGEYNVPSYSFQFDPSLQLNPATSGQIALADFQFRRNPLTYDPSNSVNAWARSSDLANTIQNLGLGDPTSSFAQQYRLYDIPTITGTEAGGGLNVSGDVAARSLLDDYRSYLGRDPDAGGWQSALNTLNNGASLQSVRDSIANSSEAQARYSSLSNRLGNGDAELIRALTDPLYGTNVSQGVGSQGFADTYAPLTQLAQDYRSYLGRDASKEEIGSWLDQLGQGRRFGDVERDIVGSKEASAYAASQGFDPQAWLANLPPSVPSPNIPGAVPNVSVPGVPTPQIPGSVPYIDPGNPFFGGVPGSVPNVSVPDVGTPSIPGSIPFTSVPDVGTPQVPGAVPNVSVPDVPPVSIPGDVPNVSVPDVALASVPGSIPFIDPGSPYFSGVTGSIPNVSAPDVGTPSIPGSVPNVSVPDVPAFNADLYKSLNPDVVANGLNPFEHYLTYGGQEGRQIAPGVRALDQHFNAQAYLAANPDVAANGLNPFEHYALYGMAEHRPLGPSASSSTPSANVGPTSFAGAWNPSAYLAANPDVAANKLDPLEHYLRYGYNEGRALDLAGTHIGGGFDAASYGAMNPDVIAAGFDPLQHYLLAGAREGRLGVQFDGSGPYSYGVFGLSGPQAFAGPSVSPTGFSNANVSGGVGTGSFADFAPPPSAPAPTPTINPYDFSGMNAGSVGVNGGFGAYAPPPTPAYNRAEDFYGPSGGSSYAPSEFADTTISWGPGMAPVSSDVPFGSDYVPSPSNVAFNTGTAAPGLDGYSERSSPDQAAHNAFMASQRANTQTLKNNQASTNALLASLAGPLQTQPINAQPLAPLPTTFAGISMFAPGII